MRYSHAIGLIGLCAIALAGCKQRSDGSEAKSVESTQRQGEYKGEVLFTVTCTDDSSHFGQREFLISEQQMMQSYGTLCKGPPVGAGGNGGGNGGGGHGGGGHGGPGGGPGGGGAGDLSIQDCGQIPESLKDIQFAVESNMFPGDDKAIALQKFCNGFMRPFAKLVESAPKFKDVLNGGNPNGVRYMLRVVKEGKVTHEAFGLITVPWDFVQVRDSFIQVLTLNGFPLLSEQCTRSFETLSDASRNVKSPMGSTCDHLNGWYRFDGAAGKRMLSVPTSNKCGTRGTWYLPKDQEPGAGAEPKDVTFIGSFEQGNNPPNMPGKVVNCASYMLYFLTSPPNWCASGYCGED